MTGRDLVTASLKLIGVAAPGQAPTSEEATDGLATLNRMLASWSTEAGLIYATVREAFTLTAGDATYTMGDGGDFDTSRPMEIEEALLRDESTSPAIERPVDILSLKEWSDITVKDLQSSYPRAIYDDGGFPRRTLTLYPVPSTGHKLVLFSTKQLTEIDSLDTVISLPPGYEETIIYNLGIRLAPEYGQTVSAEVAMIASEGLAKLKRANYRPRKLQCDSAVMGGGGSFDIQTGGSR